MIRYNGINHLAMVTGDLDGTIRYWRDLLGMRMVAGLGKPGYRHYFFEISEKDTIAFFEWPDVEPAGEKEHGRPVAGPVVFDHVSFGLETRESLWELKDRIAAAGFWVSEVIDHGFIYSIYSFDPNGIPVEFSWNVEGIDIRREPKLSDSSPSEISKEGPEPRSGRWPSVTKPTAEEDRKVYPGQGSELFHGRKKDPRRSSQ
ncbi:MAG: VOC family protein [Candidatus Sulfobium sp.]|jgi:catechol 2,3-dioxygenase-like lactoylglutathione lyase family enzyme